MNSMKAKGLKRKHLNNFYFFTFVFTASTGIGIANLGYSGEDGRHYCRSSEKTGATAEAQRQVDFDRHFKPSNRRKGKSLL